MSQGLCVNLANLCMLLLSCLASSWSASETHGNSYTGDSQTWVCCTACGVNKWDTYRSLTAEAHTMSRQQKACECALAWRRGPGTEGDICHKHRHNTNGWNAHFIRLLGGKAWDAYARFMSWCSSRVCCCIYCLRCAAMAMENGQSSASCHIITWVPAWVSFHDMHDVQTELRGSKAHSADRYWLAVHDLPALSSSSSLMLPCQERSGGGFSFRYFL